YGNFQHDYRYDDKGNAVDFHLSYPSQPDIMMPAAAAVWIGTSYANEYDEAGRLSASTMTPYGPGNGSTTKATRVVFHEDDQGRCTGTETPEADSMGTPEASTDALTRTLSYDANGRVERIEQRIVDNDAGFYHCGEFT